jgi:glucose/mannose-6-phosphate isomerase
MNLDSINLKAADPGDMLARIRELPEQCLDAWEKVQQLELPASYGDVRSIAILGMGGSAIGGDLVRTLALAACPVPIAVVRDYDLPAWVDQHTLVIASSYSGNTEETLSGFDQARGRRCKLLAITTGGKLGMAAQAAAAPIFRVTYTSSPRAALGYSITPLVGILTRLGFLEDQSSAVTEAIQVMQAWQREIDYVVPTEHNAAKQMALQLHGRIVVVYGAGLLAEVARRWKGQANENAKNWSFYEVLPELNHNAVLGYEYPEDLASRVVVVMLSSASDHPRVAIRQRVTAELLEQEGVGLQRITARGERPLAQILSTIHFGDYVSYYLALLNGVDPSHINAINYLKDVLSAA